MSTAAFIFGFFMVWVAIPGFLVYMLYQAAKYIKTKRKVVATDIVPWVRAVLDQDGPERPTEKDVEKYR